MEKAFVYGMSVAGNNFTDRIEETKRIKADFEHGINVILISPRRMGKTSLVKKVISEIDNPMIKVVYMDIYDCRSEYDFYNRFAEAIMKSMGNKLEQVVENIKQFLVRVSPKISFSPDPTSEYSLSLGITPKDYSPEEILNLPERIAQEKGIRLVVCSWRSCRYSSSSSGNDSSRSTSSSLPYSNRHRGICHISVSSCWIT